MAVAVAQPAQKKDPLDIIMQGLSIARDVYGIKADMQKSEILSKTAEREDLAAKDLQAQKSWESQGNLTPAKFNEALLSGAQEVQAGTPGAVKVNVGNRQGTAEKFVLPSSLAATERARKIADAAFDKEKLKEGKKNTDDLRGEFQTIVDKGGDASLTGTMRKARQVTNLLSADRELTGADDIALINIFSRMLSPGLVTTSDFDNAQRVGGYPEQVKAYVSKVIGDGELSPQQRAEILQSVEGMMEGAISDFESYVKHYGQLAERRGIDLDDVINIETRELPKTVSEGFSKARERLLGGTENQRISESIKRRGIFDAIPGISETAIAAPKSQSDEEALNSLLGGR
jgi:hypothetical protein